MNMVPSWRFSPVSYSLLLLLCITKGRIKGLGLGKLAVNIPLQRAIVLLCSAHSTQCITGWLWEISQRCSDAFDMWLLVLASFWPKGEGFLACTVVIVQNSLAVCFHASLKYLCNSRNKKRSLFLKLKAALSVWVMMLEEVDREVSS